MSSTSTLPLATPTAPPGAGPLAAVRRGLPLAGAQSMPLLITFVPAWLVSAGLISPMSMGAAVGVQLLAGYVPTETVLGLLLAFFLALPYLIAAITSPLSGSAWRVMARALEGDRVDLTPPRVLDRELRGTQLFLLHLLLAALCALLGTLNPWLCLAVLPLFWAAPFRVALDGRGAFAALADTALAWLRSPLRTTGATVTMLLCALPLILVPVAGSTWWGFLGAVLAPRVFRDDSPPS